MFYQCSTSAKCSTVGFNSSHLMIFTGKLICFPAVTSCLHTVIWLEETLDMQGDKQLTNSYMLYTGLQVMLLQVAWDHPPPPTVFLVCFPSFHSTSFCCPSLPNLLLLHFLLSYPFLTPPSPDEGARWSSNGAYREPAFTTSEANRQVSSAFCPTEGLSLSLSLYTTFYYRHLWRPHLQKAPSTLYRLSRWAMRASLSFLLPIFDVCQCSTSSLLLSRHFQDSRFRQR